MIRDCPQVQGGGAGKAGGAGGGRITSGYAGDGVMWKCRACGGDHFARDYVCPKHPSKIQNQGGGGYGGGKGSYGGGKGAGGINGGKSGGGGFGGGKSGGKYGGGKNGTKGVGKGLNELSSADPDFWMGTAWSAEGPGSCDPDLCTMRALCNLTVNPTPK